MKPDMDQTLKNKFKNFIAGHAGLYFKDHDLRGLESAIYERMSALKIDSLPLYYLRLTSHETSGPEFRELLNILTVNHTYFFRDEAQFKAIREKVLPDIISKRSQGLSKGQRPSIRVWSAGCSTGEEPYSMAMVIMELIPSIKEWDIMILATDVSEKVLEAARQGVYRKSSMHATDADTVEKYFTVCRSDETVEYILKDEIKKMVTFAYMNLVKDDYPSSFDIILCRNVVIYFDFNTMVEVMRRIYDSLNKEGSLFIGYSENLQYAKDKFVMQFDNEAVYYKKREDIPITDGYKLGEETVSKKAPDIDEVLEELSKAQAKADMGKEEARGKEIEPIMVQAIKHMHLKDYGRAISLAREALEIDNKSIRPRYLIAVVLAGQGKYVEAEKEVNGIIKYDMLFAPAYYLMGCILSEGGRLEDAKSFFKKTLYIDKGFILARFYLANILKNEDREIDAIREYRNILDELRKNNPKDILPYSDGLETATVINICKDNIERLKSGNEKVWS